MYTNERRSYPSSSGQPFYLREVNSGDNNNISPKHVIHVILYKHTIYQYIKYKRANNMDINN